MDRSSQKPLMQANESRFLASAIPFIRTSGFTVTTLNAAAHSCDMSTGELALICPNGASDLAALFWQSHDSIFNDTNFINKLSGLKIRDKIATLLNTRLDKAYEDDASAKHLIGFFALPHHLSLGHRLMWHTSDIIWRLAGDQALDENHYSKRMIVSGILSTAALSRLSRGREAQQEQIARNIEQVMAFEKFKAKLPTSPEIVLTNVLGFLGGISYGHSTVSTD